MGNWTMPLLLLAMLVGMMFFSSRSQKKKEREAQQMRDSLRVGDEVTTIGGIIGKIVSIKEETFVLETTRDRTRIRFLISAIRSVDVKAEESGAPRVRTTAKATEAPATEASAAQEETVAEATEAAEPAVTDEATTEEGPRMISIDDVTASATEEGTDKKRTKKTNQD